MGLQNAEEHTSTLKDNTEITLKDLLEAGVHFGHRSHKWNPKMKPYIYTKKNGIHIIDLRKSLEKLKLGCQIAEEVARKGGKILFVCTKTQGKDIVQEEAIKCGAFYVSERWLGGLLTNFSTIEGRLERMREIERMKEDGRYDKLPKKERVVKDKKYNKLLKFFKGIRDMNSLPSLVYIVDPVKEEIALKEAIKLGIPVVSLIDTNGDPEGIDYPIPGNDDAIRSISLVTEAISASILKSRQAAEKEKIETKKGD